MCTEVSFEYFIEVFYYFILFFSLLYNKIALNISIEFSIAIYLYYFVANAIERRRKQEKRIDEKRENTSGRNEKDQKQGKKVCVSIKKL